MTKNIKFKDWLFTASISLVLYSIFSTLFDEVYFIIDKGTSPGIIEALMHYVLYGMIVGFFSWIIITITYTLLYFSFQVDHWPVVLKLLFGMTFGTLFGYLMQDAEGSFYIGNLRPERNLFLFPTIGLFLELVRLVIHKFNKNGTRV